MSENRVTYSVCILFICVYCLCVCVRAHAHVRVCACASVFTHMRVHTFRCDQHLVLGRGCTTEMHP